MKFFENPEIEVIKFVMADVITTSGGDVIGPGTGDNQTPWG